MEENEAIAVLSALAHATRIAAYRHLAATEPEGMVAGALARQLAVPQSTLSAHLSVLSSAGLVYGVRRSRTIVYRADLARIGDAFRFVLADCCGGNPAACAALLGNIDSRCPPANSVTDQALR